MSTPQPAIIDFDVHQNLIHDLVKSQNGTLATALRELVMNSVDAGADRISIELSENTFSVEDNGCGFESRDDIEQNFRVFGQPHDDGDAVYGRFRIGRGQIMAFAAVDWISNQFQMSVDIESHGYGFQLTEFEDVAHNGCLVEGRLYDVQHPYSLEKVCRELRLLVEYSPIDIYLNGYPISGRTARETWDVETESYKIRWKSNSDIVIYNLGIFVKKISFGDMNIGAIVVTSKPLQLNMARNEVTTRDSLWCDIRERLYQKGMEEARNGIYSTHPTAAQRQNIIRQFIRNDLPRRAELDMIPLLVDVRGASLHLSQILDDRRARPITLCPDHQKRIGERIATENRAFVISSSSIDEWDDLSWIGKADNAAQLLERIATIIDTQYFNDDFSSEIRAVECVDFSVLASEYTLNEKELPLNQCTRKERIAVRALTTASRVIADQISEVLSRKVKTRSIRLGESDMNFAWTDGYETIWIDRKLLKTLDLQANQGGVSLVLMMLHEYLHTPGDTDETVHNLEFFKLYHDLSTNRSHIVGKAAKILQDTYLKGLRKTDEGVPTSIVDYHRRLSTLNDETLAPGDYATPIEFFVYLKQGSSKLSLLDSIALKKLMRLRPRKVAHSEDPCAFAFTAKEYFHPNFCFKSTAYAYTKVKRVYREGYKGKYAYCLDHQATFENCLSSLLKKHPKIGVDKESWEQLLDCRSTVEVLHFLTSQPSSNIQGFAFGAQGAWKLCTPELFVRHHIDFHHFSNPHPKSDKPWDRSSRLQMAGDVIEYAYGMLRNPEERAELARVFLSETGKARLDTVVVDDAGDTRGLRAKYLYRYC